MDSLGLLGTEDHAKLDMDSWTPDLQKVEHGIFDIYDFLSYPLIVKVSSFPLILLAKFPLGGKKKQNRKGVEMIIRE